MKKYGIGLITCLMAVFCLMAISYADEMIAGKSDIGIVIEGRMVTYSDEPIVVKGRTLLPLRALLADLGVRNDDEHISWNASEKTITVLKDSTRICLKEGSTEASVNDSPILMDTAPVIHKNRVYIPARAVAQIFGKRVVWHEATRTVFIRDEASFNEVKNILEKSAAAMNELKRAIYNQKTIAVISRNEKYISFEENTEGKVDRENKKMNLTGHVNFKQALKEVKYEVYRADNAEYIKESDKAEWEKKVMTPEEFEEGFAYEIFKSDGACAGLIEAEGAEPGKIILMGRASPENNLNSKLELLGIEKFKLEETYFELHIERETGIVTRSYCMVMGKVTSIPGSPDFILNMVEENRGFNEDFKIEKPEGLK